MVAAASAVLRFLRHCIRNTPDFRYTSDSVFDTFRWPQNPSLAQAMKVAAAAGELRTFRRKVMADNNWSLRDLYRTLDVPGLNPLRDLHDELDVAVRAAYGMKAKADVLAFLLDLNHQLAAAEKAGKPITAPSLDRPTCLERGSLDSNCRISMRWLRKERDDLWGRVYNER